MKRVIVLSLLLLALLPMTVFAAEILDEYDYTSYSSLTYTEWTESLNEGGRNRLANTMLSLFKEMGYDIYGAAQENMLAEIDRACENNPELTVWQAACEAVDADPNLFEEWHEGFLDFEYYYSLMDWHAYATYSALDGGDWANAAEMERELWAAKLLLLYNALEYDVVYRLPEQYAEDISETFASIGESYSLWEAGTYALGIDGYFFAYVYTLYDEGAIVSATDYAAESVYDYADAKDTLASDGQELLCYGAEHLIADITYDWATREEAFMSSSGIYPIADDVGASQSITISGSNGYLDSCSIGPTDLLEPLHAMGAIDIYDDNALLHDPIQFVAYSAFNAPRLFLLSRGEDERLQITMLTYDAEEEAYAWNGQLYTRYGMAAFDGEGNFYCELEEGVESF